LIKNPQAGSQAIDQLRAAYPSLPASYLAFLEASDGAEGDARLEALRMSVFQAAVGGFQSS